MARTGASRSRTRAVAEFARAAALASNAAERELSAARAAEAGEQARSRSIVEGGKR